MLKSPDHAIFGVTNLEAAIGFLRELGFNEEATTPVPHPAARVLYGLEVETRQSLLAVPGAPTGGVRVVETPNPATKFGPYDHRGHGVDLYTTDIDESLEIAGRAGASCGPIGSYTVGPLEVKEAKVDSPEGVHLVFLEANKRRPSVLDRSPERLHSELHSIVWIVESLSTATAFWRDRLGFTSLLETTLCHPAVAKFMGLPREDVALSLALLADEALTPSRLELVEFPDEQGADHSRLPLRPGLHALGFVVNDIEAAAASFAGASVAEPVSFDCPPYGKVRACAGVCPAGVPFEIWQGLRLTAG